MRARAVVFLRTALRWHQDPGNYYCKAAKRFFGVQRDKLIKKLKGGETLKFFGVYDDERRWHRVRAHARNFLKEKLKLNFHHFSVEIHRGCRPFYHDAMPFASSSTWFVQWNVWRMEAIATSDNHSTVLFSHFYDWKMFSCIRCRYLFLDQNFSLNLSPGEQNIDFFPI